MNFGRQLVGFTLGVVLLFGVSCTKKPPQLPPQAKNPVDTEEVPLPYEISEATAPPPPAPEPKVEAPAPEPPKPPPPKHRKKKPVQAPATTAAAPTTPPANASSGAAASPSANSNNTIASARPPANPAAEAPPPDTAIAAGVSNAQLSQQKQTTAQMLEATEKTLGGLNRSLSHDEEEMVAQVRSYIAQSRKATTDGDFERAYNLATKAHLLSDALVKK